jgi:phosphoribosylformylglycinamidine synthase PurS subunit
MDRGTKVFLARIRVSLKPTVNDPQGKTIAQALGRLGFDTIESVRAGKYFEVRIDETDQQAAETKVQSMCSQLLANPVIERFDFDLEPVA